MGEHFRRDGPRQGPGTGGTTDDEIPGELLDLEGVSAVLDHPRRRRVLGVVEEREAISMRDLAAAVAAREADVPVREVAEDRRRSVAIALHHVHVPKLAEAGVLSVDRDEDRVETGPRLDRVISALGGLCDESGGDGLPDGNSRSD